MYPIGVALAAIFRLTSARLMGTGLIARNSTPNIFQIQANLGPKLSKGASLYFPSSPGFSNHTERWSAATEGDVLVVVEVRCEKDVETAVCSVSSLPPSTTYQSFMSRSNLQTISIFPFWPSTVAMAYLSHLTPSSKASLSSWIT